MHFWNLPKMLEFRAECLHGASQSQCKNSLTMIYHFKKTFIGVGGREYINNPKLSFPEHVKIRRRGTNPKSGQPYAEAGSAFVETSSIASRLCCSASAARQYLHRHGARFRVVRKGTVPWPCTGGVRMWTGFSPGGSLYAAACHRATWTWLRLSTCWGWCAATFTGS